MLRQIVAQCLHPLLVSPRQIYIRYLVESDEVHPALQPLKQFDNLAGMGRRIVQPSKADILKRAAALVGEIVLLQQLNNLSDRHLTLGRHQPLALFGQGRVHRDSHVAFTLVEEPFQLSLYAHTAHRDAFGTPGVAIVCREYLCGPQHIVEVIHRLTLSHKHDIRQRIALWQRINLVQDVACGEITFKALFARLAEQTIHLTAHLTRHTQRGPLAIRDIDSLNKLRTVAYREEIFDGAVLRALAVNGIHSTDDAVLLQPLTISL